MPETTKLVAADTATHIQDLSARLKAKAVKDCGFPGGNAGEFVGFVEEL
jgi:hypothetical protein